MSGDVVALRGSAMDAFIASIARLAPSGPVVIGGLAVMCRVGGEHRPTLDVDGAFDNDTDIPTTQLLVDQGIAVPGDAGQRVMVGSAVIDVIDTFAIDAADLPDDDPKSRLFVCAHRYAFETATAVTFVGDTETATVRVATVDALISMKTHALRYASTQRRMVKRSSDLFDLFLLALTTRAATVLDNAPWDLRGQCRSALAADLEDIEAAAAVLRRSPVPAINSVDADTLTSVVADLLDRLG